MARERVQSRMEYVEIQFVDELPNKGDFAGWNTILTVLLDHPGRWARVREMESIQQAGDAASNLRKRAIRIPRSDHEWEFASRGADVYAKYVGPKNREIKKQPKAMRRVKTRTKEATR